MVPPAAQRGLKHQFFDVFLFYNSMSKHKIFLNIVIFASFIAVVFGSVKNFSGIAWPFAPLGIFIWGDAIILGPFLLISALILKHKNNSALTGFWFSLYIAVRSFVEIFYNLSAQFSTTTRPWETSIREYTVHIGKDVNEIFVLGQLLFTIIFIISVYWLIYFAKKYFIHNS